MENLSAWWDAFEQSLSTSMTSMGEYLPILGAAAAVMLIGWLLAKLLRAALLRSGGAVSRVFDRIHRPLSAAGLRVSQRFVALAANVFFWIVILMFAAVAARVARLDAFSGWLDRIVAYLPTLIAGLLIALAGYLLSTLVRDIVKTTMASVGSTPNQLAALAAQGAVFVTALVIGLDQVGIDVTFLIILAAVLIGGALLSIAIAFGFGAREFVGNLVAAHQLRGTLTAGDHARFGDVEGRVLEVTQTMVVLVNERGRYLVPASYMQTQISAILAGEADD